jgi:hypothetical protein
MGHFRGQPWLVGRRGMLRAVTTRDGGQAPGWLGPMLSKYSEMLRLRLGDLDGTIEDPRTAMAALAGRFPGALREIDELPLDELLRRVRCLEAVSRGEDGQDAGQWAPVHDRYHALLRGALWAKRWLAGRLGVSEAEHEAFARDARDAAWPADAGAWAEQLELVARPTSGRITVVVVARVGRELGLNPELVVGVLHSHARKGCAPARLT